MDDDAAGLETGRREFLYCSGAVLGGGVLSGCLDGLGGDDRSPAIEPADVPYDVSVDHDLEAWEGYDPDWAAPTYPPTQAGYEVETLVENLAIPWDLSFRGPGDVVVTERVGRMLVIEGGETRPIARPESAIDAEALAPGSQEDSWLVEGGEGGLLGVAAHPTYPEPPLVYAYFTAETDEGRMNRVVAFDASADDPASAVWPIVEDIPAHTYHNGGRIEFGPANYLWITTGDGDPGLENPGEIRRPDTLGGKVLRVEPDGTVPADNPTYDRPADGRVYTYGHRNPQGIAWLPDGTPVMTEHGPGGGDEVSVLRAGGDYGWPDVRTDAEYTDYANSSATPPVAVADSWAPSGCVFYTGSAVPALQNRLLVGGLISQQVIALTITEGETPPGGHDTAHDEPWMDPAYSASSTAILEDELGRVRHIEQGPDGALYAITSNRDGRAQGRFPTERDDRLVRIRPADA